MVESAVSPVFIEAMEDGTDNLVDALGIGEDHQD
jgi:hypothetical protein